MNSIQQTILPFQLKKTNDCITSRSGLAIYLEAAIGFGLTKKIKEIFPRSGSNRGHNAHDIIMSLILMMLAGGQHMNDIREIAQDKGLLKVCGIKKVPSPDAIARFLSKKNNLRLFNFIIEYLNNQILKQMSLNELTVDIDATLIESNKQNAAITYKGFKGYCPLLSFEASSGLCLAGKFRDGNESPSSGVTEQIKYINRYLKKFKKQLKYVRSDSAAYNHKFFDFCFENGIIFTVTADHDSAVISAIKSILESEWKPLFDEDGVKTDREYATTVHAFNANTNAFTLVVQRWKNPQMNLFEPDKYCYHVIATNDFNSDGRDIILFHNKRGNAENYIKELKCGFGLENIPTGQLYSNAVYFAIGLLALNLAVGVKEFLPQDFKKSTIATLRFYLILIPGKVILHGRQIILKMQKRFLEFISSIRRNIALAFKI